MQSEQPQVRSYLAWSIVCVFLFWPLAIPAIIFASKVKTLVTAGDYQGGVTASRQARMWAIWATGVGAAVWGLSCCAVGLTAAVAPAQFASLISHLVGHT
jgi:hypothetical protein